MERETNEDILALIDLGVATIETQGADGNRVDLMGQSSYIALND